MKRKSPQRHAENQTNAKRTALPATVYQRFEQTPIGLIGIETDGDAITHVYFGGGLPVGRRRDTSEKGPEKAKRLLNKAFRQLAEYFAGRRHDFDLPLAPQGTPFMQSVWAELCKVPFGKTATYKQIAERVKSPKAFRAVGLANNRNPIPIFIPCHRIVGSDGSLVGYAGGLDMKRQLLDSEAAFAHR